MDTTGWFGGIMSRRIKTNYSYKGWNLVMTLEGYMWTCQYIMRRSGRTVMDGFPGSTYLSREEAGETALSTAKGLIDQCQLDKNPLDIYRVILR
jgi:hypothetical protein